MRYHFVATLQDVPSGRPTRVKVGNRFVVLVRKDDEVFAVSDACPHEETSLSEGFVGGYVIECPLHGSRFDVRTGEALSLPARQPLQTFPVLVDGTDVLVGVEDGRAENERITTLA